MSSKFNIELAQGTVTVEGDEEFIKAVYQALQDTLLSGDAPAKVEKADAVEAEEATAPAPEPARTEAKIEAEAEIEAPVESVAGQDENVTPINVAEAELEPEETAEELIDEDGAASLESVAPKYEPIPAVLDPDRAEREKAEAAAAGEEARATAEASVEAAPANRSSVLEQIKENLDDEDSGSQTSILQRIRDSLSEDAGDNDETPRAADAG